jgi:hypothetical protein
VPLAPASSGFPVELSGIGKAAFLDESRTCGCWWGPVQEISDTWAEKMGAALRSLLPFAQKFRS